MRDLLDGRNFATATDHGGRELINSLSLKYDGTAFPVEPADRVRVVVRVRPGHVAGNPGLTCVTFHGHERSGPRTVAA